MSWKNTNTKCSKHTTDIRSNIPKATDLLKRYSNKDKQSVSKNLQEATEHVFLHDSSGYGSLFRAAASGAFLGLVVSPSYAYLRNIGLTQFNHLRFEHLYGTNQIAAFKHCLRVIGKPMMIGAALNVSYTIFFKYFLAKLPFKEEQIYPIGLGAFASGATYAFGGRGFIKSFILGAFLGLIIRFHNYGLQIQTSQPSRR